MSSLKLNLGSGHRPIEGYLNIDKFKWPGVDTIVDLARVPWPWSTSSVSRIVARDVLNHLPNKIASMNEIWRVCAPDAIVEIRVPITSSPMAFADPTIRSYWNERSFLYFTKSDRKHARFSASYGISASFSNEKQSADADSLTIILRALKG